MVEINLISIIILKPRIGKFKKRKAGSCFGPKNCVPPGPTWQSQAAVLLLPT
jgi:hypothetical protein